jgi:hypothetical protein
MVLNRFSLSKTIHQDPADFGMWGLMQSDGLPALIRQGSSSLCGVNFKVLTSIAQFCTMTRRFLAALVAPELAPHTCCSICIHLQSTKALAQELDPQYLTPSSWLLHD